MKAAMSSLEHVDPKEVEQKIEEAKQRYIDEFLFVDIEDTLIAPIRKQILAAQLRALMKRKGITKRKMAKHMNVPVLTVERLLDDQVQAVTLRILVLAVEAVGMNLQVRIV